MTTAKDQRIADLIGQAISASKAAGKGGRRHPAEVTSDRLADAAEKWNEHFSGALLDAVGQIRDVLESIAEEDRS